MSEDLAIVQCPAPDATDREFGSRLTDEQIDRLTDKLWEKELLRISDLLWQRRFARAIETLIAETQRSPSPDAIVQCPACDGDISDWIAKHFATKTLVSKKVQP